MDIVWKLSENPNLQDELYIEKLIKKEKKEIQNEAKKEISVEKFYHMSWEKLKENIRVVDNKLTLFWRNIDYWLSEFMWSSEQLKWYKEFSENFIKNQTEIIDRIDKQFKDKNLIIDILDIWLDEAKKQSAWVWFTAIRTDDNIIIDNIKEINKELKWTKWKEWESDIKGLNDVVFEWLLNPGNNSFDIKLNKIFDLMKKSEQEESIIWEDDLNEIKDIFFNRDNKYKTFEEKQVKIFNLMRYWWLSWNSEWVKNTIAYKLIEKEEFKIEKDILDNPMILEYLEDKNLKRLEGLLWKDLADSVLWIYNKTEEKTLHWLKMNLSKVNEERKKGNKKLLNLEEYKKETNIYDNILTWTLEWFKHILISNNLSKRENRWNEINSLTWIYANMSGLSEYNWTTSDILTISDNNIDLAVDFASTIAIWIVTMWAWIWLVVVSRGAMLARRANKVSKLWKAFRATSMWLKVWKYKHLSIWGKVVVKWGYIWELVWGSILDWIAFHEWATLMQNIMFREFKDMWEWLNDFNHIIKSIAFMWWLNSLQFVSKLPWMWKIMNFEMKIPKDYLKPSVIKKVLINTWNFSLKSVKEWSIMFWISWATEQWLWEWWDPSVEEYLHFVALIQIMHLKDMKRR